MEGCDHAGLAAFIAAGDFSAESRPLSRQFNYAERESMDSPKPRSRRQATQMLERIFDFIASSWNVIKPWVVVADYEGGVVLRFGRYDRTLEPGLHWKLPLADSTITTSTVITTMALRPQTLTTRDDLSVVISAIVKYHIADVRAYLLDIWDSADVLNDVTLGAIKEIVASVEYTDLQKLEIEEKVLDFVRAEAEKFGVHVHKVTFSDLGKVRSIRLITSEPSGQ